MGQKKAIYVLFGLASFIIVGLILSVLPAHAQEGTSSQISKAGRFGIGGDISAVNFSLGPMVKYWITDNIGAQLTYSAIGGFTGFNIRGIYEFSKAIDLANERLNPYLAIGYSSIKKEEDYGGASLTYKGSGPFFSGGLEGSLGGWNSNLFYTAEFLFSPFDLEATYKAESIYGYGSESETVKADFSNFGVGMSMIYYF